MSLKRKRLTKKFLDARKSLILLEFLMHPARLERATF
jgi:hypothetical protein